MTSGGPCEARKFRIPFPTVLNGERQSERREVSSQTHLVPLQIVGKEWASGSCPSKWLRWDFNPALVLDMMPQQP